MSSCLHIPILLPKWSLTVPQIRLPINIPANILLPVSAVMEWGRSQRDERTRVRKERPLSWIEPDMKVRPAERVRPDWKVPI